MLLPCNLAFSKRIVQLLAGIVTRSNKNVAVNILSSPRERLCAYIDSTQSDGHFTSNYIQLAEILDISDRHLFWELGRLCADGILAKQQHAYRISDVQALRALAADC